MAMQLELLVRTNEDGGTCYDTNCPSAFRVHGGRGGYVIVGLAPDAEMLALLNEVPNGEAAVWVPDQIIEETLNRR